VYAVIVKLESLSSEEHQQDFLRQFFGATKPYMGFIRLIILFIQYQLRNPASTNATMHRWVGELSSLIIMVYCNRVAVDERYYNYFRLGTNLKLRSSLCTHFC
jgi:hypothetical protein